MVSDSVGISDDLVDLIYNLLKELDFEIDEVVSSDELSNVWIDLVIKYAPDYEKIKEELGRYLNRVNDGKYYL